MFKYSDLKNITQLAWYSWSYYVNERNMQSESYQRDLYVFTKVLDTYNFDIMVPRGCTNVMGTLWRPNNPSSAHFTRYLNVNTPMVREGNWESQKQDSSAGTHFNENPSNSSSDILVRTKVVNQIEHMSICYFVFILCLPHMTITHFYTLYTLQKNQFAI